MIDPAMWLARKLIPPLPRYKLSYICFHTNTTNRPCSTWTRTSDDPNASELCSCGVACYPRACVEINPPPQMPR